MLKYSLPVDYFPPRAAKRLVAATDLRRQEDPEIVNVPSESVTEKFGNGSVAGPARTSPVDVENCEEWQGQVILSSVIVRTWQP